MKETIAIIVFLIYFFSILTITQILGNVVDYWKDNVQNRKLVHLFMFSIFLCILISLKYYYEYR